MELVVHRGGATFPARWCCRKTPGQAWEAGEHRGTYGTPIGIAVLEAAATTYMDRNIVVVATVSRQVTGIVVITPLQSSESGPVRAGRL